ncbi:MAG: VanZ family protein [Pseudomonadota bacterium]
MTQHYSSSNRTGLILAWLWVGLCIAAIFAAVPIARALQSFVAESFGRGAFAVVTIASGAIAFAFAWRNIRSSGGGVIRHLVLVCATSTFLYYIYTLRGNPEEALHFVEYGLLTLLLIRALAFTHTNYTVYLSSFLIVLAVGMLDESVQWATPGRYWGFKDIGLDASAAALVVVAVALGIRPANLSRLPALHEYRYLSLIGIATVVLSLLTVLNTPARIAWYTQKIPALEFLASSGGVMWEYGYKYRDGNLVFRSRLAADELRTQDRTRAESAAVILDQFIERRSYREFLQKYTPVNDPFLHELRVHFFRRDLHVVRSQSDEYSDEVRRDLATIAFAENEIVERFFSNTLNASNYLWTPDEKAAIAAMADTGAQYDSAVSRNLFTEMGEPPLLAFLGLLLFGFVVLFAVSTRSSRRVTT